MPGTQAGSRGSLAPGPHTTRHAGPHRAVPGTSRPVGRQAGATQITPVEKGQAMTRHRITHLNVRCSTSTWGTIPRSRSLSENSVVGPRASIFFAWQRRRSRRCWFNRRCSRMKPGGKRAGRSQIEFSDGLQGSVLHCRKATTMTSADFCPIILRVTTQDAAGIAGRPVGQTSPDKSMNFRKH